MNCLTLYTKLIIHPLVVLFGVFAGWHPMHLVSSYLLSSSHSSQTSSKQTLIIVPYSCFTEYVLALCYLNSEHLRPTVVCQSFWGRLVAWLFGFWWTSNLTVYFLHTKDVLASNVKLQRLHSFVIHKHKKDIEVAIGTVNFHPLVRTFHLLGGRNKFLDLNKLIDVHEFVHCLQRKPKSSKEYLGHLTISEFTHLPKIDLGITEETLIDPLTATCALYLLPISACMNARVYDLVCCCIVYAFTSLMFHRSYEQSPKWKVFNLKTYISVLAYFCMRCIYYLHPLNVFVYGLCFISCCLWVFVIFKQREACLIRTRLYVLYQACCHTLICLFLFTHAYVCKIIFTAR
jgi:hypothetical protein